MNKEIEVKIKPDDRVLKIVEAWLKTNAKSGGVVSQVDYYFDNPSNTFFYNSDYRGRETDNYFRLRKTDKFNYICLKKIKRGEKGKPLYAEEFEVVVDDAGKALDLIKALGYTDVVTIFEKKREIYLYGAFEIAIDRVEELGVFIEIELKEEVEDFKDGYTLIYDFLRSIGVRKFRKQPQGYVHQLWNPGLDLGEEVEL